MFKEYRIMFVVLISFLVISIVTISFIPRYRAVLKSIHQINANVFDDDEDDV